MMKNKKTLATVALTTGLALTAVGTIWSRSCRGNRSTTSSNSRGFVSYR